MSLCRDGQLRRLTEYRAVALAARRFCGGHLLQRFCTADSCLLPTRAAVAGLLLNPISQTSRPMKAFAYPEPRKVI